MVRLQFLTLLISSLHPAFRRLPVVSLCLGILFLSVSCVQTPKTRSDRSVLVGYTGPSVSGVDTSTLDGKVMTGYQGWFNAKGDGANLGWTHWARSRDDTFGPESVTVDLWPDMSEYGQHERFETGFRNLDGTKAEVFSSYTRDTVVRHFEWMREYGIDGAFVQRFVRGAMRADQRHHKNVVLSNAREGANLNGRSYAVMYDLSGLPQGGTDYVKTDWAMLRDRMKITSDSAYQHHNGKPLVAVWGIGFNDKGKARAYTLEECRSLVAFLKADGCAVMIGAPTGWRELTRESVTDTQLHEILKMADVVSPWTVGRYKSPESVARHAKLYWAPDIEWCDEQDLDYLPVIYPGFSWHHLKGAELGAIPRLKGKFFWSQVVEAKKAGANMLYVAMFDEVDEGTAIFKVTDDYPKGDGLPFLTYEGLPSDHYLYLTGQAARALRGEIPLTAELPVRLNQDAEQSTL